MSILDAQQVNRDTFDVQMTERIREVDVERNELNQMTGRVWRGEEEEAKTEGTSSELRSIGRSEDSKQQDEVSPMNTNMQVDEGTNKSKEVEIKKERKTRALNNRCARGRRPLKEIQNSENGIGVHTKRKILMLHEIMSELDSTDQPNKRNKKKSTDRGNASELRREGTSPIWSLKQT